MTAIASARPQPKHDTPVVDKHGYRPDVGPIGPPPRRPVFGRRGKLPILPERKEYRCSCGKFIISGYMPPGSSFEGWCNRCRESVVFET